MWASFVMLDLLPAANFFALGEYIRARRRMSIRERPGGCSLLPKLGWPSEAVGVGGICAPPGAGSDLGLTPPLTHRGVS